jgi:hypothetical protein
MLCVNERYGHPREARDRRKDWRVHMKKVDLALFGQCLHCFDGFVNVTSELMNDDSTVVQLGHQRALLRERIPDFISKPATVTKNRRIDNDPFRTASSETLRDEKDIHRLESKRRTCAGGIA